MLAKLPKMCIILLKGFASIFCKEMRMERNYEYGDVIEYLGLRYYVIGGNMNDWICINGHSFNVCLLPKSKITKLIGKSEIDFGKEIRIVTSFRRSENGDRMV